MGAIMTNQVMTKRTQLRFKQANPVILLRLRLKYQRVANNIRTLSNNVVLLMSLGKGRGTKL